MRSLVHYLLIFSVTVMLGAALLTIGLWLTFQNVPSWYKPAEAGRVSVEKMRNQMGRWADAIGDHLAQRQPYQWTVRRDEANQVLAVLDQIMPGWDAVWPDQMTQPAISFDEDRIHVGVLYDDGKWRAVLNLSIEVKVTPESVFFRLERVHGGSLPIPADLLDTNMDKIKSAVRRRVAVWDPTRREWVEKALSQVYSLESLYTGIWIENRFVWPNGRQAFRIKDLKLENDDLNLTLEPLP